MTKTERKRPLDDASAGGKRSAMAPEEDPGGAPRDGPALATRRNAGGPGANTGAGEGLGAGDGSGDGGAITKLSFYPRFMWITL